MTRAPDRTFKTAAHDLLLQQVRSGGRGAEVLEFQSVERDHRRGLRTGVGSVVVLATLAAAWFGIIALVDHRAGLRPAVSPAVTSPPPEPTPSLDPIAESLTGVVGSGSFKGQVTGAFTITQSDSGPELHLRDFDSGGRKQMQVLVAVDLASAACRGDGVGTIAGTVTDAKMQTVVLQDSSPQAFSDLSYMHAIGLWPMDGCSGSDPGVVTSIPAASILWKVPAALRNLASTDAGAESGARGTVEMKNGRPQRYTVAADDQLAAVAKRFDLTSEDLLYLNPLRRRGNSTTLYVDEQLNLDQTDRDWFWR